ncbi:MAG: hypothetical protein WC602_03010 [archaeon]
MNGISGLASEAMKRTNSVHSDVSTASWHELSRTVFSSTLERTITGLLGLRETISEIIREMEKEALNESHGSKELIAEYDSVIKLLKRNLALETGKQKVKGRNYERMLNDKSEAPELYASLEQKVLGLILKTGFFLQRVQVQLNSMGMPAQGKADSGLATLVNARENEISELKKKYEELKAKTYYARVGEKSSADMEQVVSEIARKIEAEARALSLALKAQEKKFGELEKCQSETANSAKALGELALNYADKSSDLATEFKKERDFAKKMVLEIENETMQLRHAYSTELVKMQETRNELRRELLQEFSSRTSKLEKELEEKSEMLTHFRGIAES